MRTKLIITAVLGLTIHFLLAQAPQSFKYQAVIRDTTGNVLSDKLISLRISILQGDMYGEEIYSEIHDIWTDKLGLVTLNIGQGTEISRNFSEIQWGEDTHYVKIEIDLDGTMNYHLLGISQLMSVPYALYAEGSGDKVWEKGENGIYFSEGRVGIGSDDPQKTLDVKGHTMLRANTTLGSGNWIGLYFNGYGDDDQPEWLFASHNQGGFQFRRWDGVDFSEHYLKVNEGSFRFGAYDSPPLKYLFHGWAFITDSLKVGSNNFFVGSDGKVGIGTNTPSAPMQIIGKSEQYEGRDILMVQNKSVDDVSMATVKIKAGDGNTSTILQHTSDTYQWEDMSEIGMLGNDGKGIVLAATNEAGEIRFETGGAGLEKERMRITEEGKVGIGTTNPQRKLHINDVMRLEPRYFPPEDPSEGDIYMDGNEHVLKVYDGTNWKSCW